MDTAVCLPQQAADRQTSTDCRVFGPTGPAKVNPKGPEAEPNLLV